MPPSLRRALVMTLALTAVALGVDYARHGPRPAPRDRLPPPPPMPASALKGGRPAAAPGAPAGEIPPRGDLDGLRALCPEDASLPADSRPPAVRLEEPVQTLDMTGCGGPGAFSTRVVRDARAWAALGRELGWHEGKPPDFGSRMAVGVLSGLQPRWAMFALVEVRESGGLLRVLYRKGRAGPPERESCRGPWKPYHIRVLPRSKLPVRFERAGR